MILVSTLTFILREEQTSPLLSLLTVLMCGVAFLGYAALWRAAVRPVDTMTAVGLAIGIAANIFGAVMAYDINPRAIGDWYLFFTPAAVGAAHILVYVVARVRGT
jgi:hypothetical protein